MKVNFNDLTILLISYFSTKDIRRLLKKIHKKIKVVVIDNAQEKDFEKKFSKFKNVKLIKSKYNAGQVGGINLGLKNIKTKYLLYMDPDVYFKSSLILSFLEEAKKINDFIILAPQHEKSIYKKEFISKKNNEIKNTILMKIVHGHFLFFNMKNVRKVGYYDDNIWMYYDETDYCLRAYRKKHKIYVIPKFKVIHKGGSSINLGKTINIEAHHKWHFMWSKFYFYKKNFNIFKAYQETSKDLVTLTLKFLFFFLFNKRKRIIYFSALSGLINSYLNNKSYKRL